METILKTLSKIGISEGIVVGVLFVVLAFGLVFIIPSLALDITRWLFGLAPLWLPAALALFFWQVWLWYIRSKFIAEQDVTLLEIRIPRDIEKSPRAMEAIFDGVHIGIGESTFIDTLIKGRVRPWFSFELASISGHIHFYIWTRSFFKDIVEAQIYAQYPEVEIYEVDDYASRFTYDPTQHDVWGCDFKKEEKDVYPIKTYVDYELDKDPKEEFKVDPLAHLFEYLSTVKEGEQVWMQILLRTNKEKRHKKNSWLEKENRWRGEAQDEVEGIKERTALETQSILDPTETVKGAPVLLPADREKIDAIQRSIGKKAYDVGIRAIHIGPRDDFRGINIVGLIGVFKQFASENLNGLEPTRWFVGFSYPWEDFRKMRQERLKPKVIDAFRRRSWFFAPYKTKPFVMTTEELATVYHFPSRTIEAPGLQRIPATKEAAPPNLPTG